MKSEKPQHGQGREALLAAVVEVTAEKGLRGMTFRAVAEAAGVNNTLIAHHFGTRDALLEAALEWAVDQSLRQTSLSDYATDTATFRKDLVDSLVSDSSLQVFQYEMILEANRQEHLKPLVHHLYQRYLDEFTRGREKLGAPGGVALNRAMFAALDGLVFQYLTHAITRDEFAEAVDALGELVIAHSPTG